MFLHSKLPLDLLWEQNWWKSFFGDPKIFGISKNCFGGQNELAIYDFVKGWGISQPQTFQPQASTPNHSTSDFSTPWFKNSWLKSPELKNSWLKVWGWEVQSWSLGWKVRVWDVLQPFCTANVFIVNYKYILVQWINLKNFVLFTSFLWN